MQGYHNLILMETLLNISAEIHVYTNINKESKTYYEIYHNHVTHVFFSSVIRQSNLTLSQIDLLLISAIPNMYFISRGKII
jgi:hypothetical protein